MFWSTFQYCYLLLYNILYWQAEAKNRANCVNIFMPFFGTGANLGVFMRIFGAYAEICAISMSADKNKGYEPSKLLTEKYCFPP